MTLDYRRPGPFTTLDPSQLALAASLPDDPVAICSAARGLVIHPFEATPLGMPETRLAEKQIRPVNQLIEALVALDPAPLHEPRPEEKRIVGTCRTFATLSCALLRLRGISARARAGFATYFVAGRNLDHWIVEYDAGDRWVRVDSQVLGQSFVPRPDDLAPGEFLTGGEAWTAYRGGADGQSFGVAGTDHAWGPAEIRGNAIRDLAALCDREMLPWDEWGRMTASYEGRTGADYDQLIDRIAAACAADDPEELTRLYASEDLSITG